MTDGTTQSAEDCQPCQRPRFRGCIVCYSAEWCVHLLRRLYRTVAR